MNKNPPKIPPIPPGLDTPRLIDAVNERLRRIPTVTAVTTAATTAAATALSLSASGSSGQVGIAFAGFFKATGGAPPYTYALVGGGGALPGGLSLNTSTGAITGTPTTGGTFNFSVKVTDAAFAGKTLAWSITIIAAGALTITFQGSLGQVSAPFQASLKANGGVLPYTFSQSGGTGLPAGVTLATNGQLSGTPTTAGAYTFTGTVTDAAMNTATVSCSITIVAVPTPGTTPPDNPSALSIAEVAGSRVLSQTDGNFPTTTVRATVTLPGTGTAPDHVNFAYWNGICLNGLVGQLGTQSTTLAVAMTSGDLSMTLASNTDAIGGVFRFALIDSEWIYISSNGGAVIERGAMGTTPALHLINAPVQIIQLGALGPQPITGTTGVFDFAGIECANWVFGLVVSTGNAGGDNWWPIACVASNELTLATGTPTASDVQSFAIAAFSNYNGASYSQRFAYTTVNASSNFWYANFIVRHYDPISQTTDPSYAVVMEASPVVGSRSFDKTGWGFPPAGDAYPWIWLECRVTDHVQQNALLGVLQQCMPDAVHGANYATHLVYNPANQSVFPLSGIPTLERAPAASGANIKVTTVGGVQTMDSNLTVGDNLLINAGGESDVQGWSGATTTGFSTTTAQNHTVNGARCFTCATALSGSASLAIYQRIACKPGDQFAASVWYLASAGGNAGLAGVYVRFLTAAGVLVAGTLVTTNGAAATTWTQIAVLAAAAPATAVLVEIGIELTGNPTSSGTWYWDDAYAVRVTPGAGTVATAAGGTAVNPGAGTTILSNAVTLALGNGLSFSGSNLVANLGNGLTFLGPAVTLALGNGLAFSAGNVQANLGNGLSFSGTAVQLNLGGGLSFSGSTVQVATGAGVTLTGGNLAIALGANSGLSLSGSVLSASVGPGVQISSGSMTLNLGNGLSISGSVAQVNATNGLNFTGAQLQVNPGSGLSIISLQVAIPANGVASSQIASLDVSRLNTGTMAVGSGGLTISGSGGLTVLFGPVSVTGGAISAFTSVTALTLRDGTTGTSANMTGGTFTANIFQVNGTGIVDASRNATFTSLTIASQLAIDSSGNHTVWAQLRFPSGGTGYQTSPSKTIPTTGNLVACAVWIPVYSSGGSYLGYIPVFNN